jgi:hypothetical protein
MPVFVKRHVRRRVWKRSRGRYEFEETVNSKLDAKVIARRFRRAGYRARVFQYQKPRENPYQDDSGRYGIYAAVRKRKRRAR